MRASLVLPDDARWIQVLGEARHDVYHLPAYVQFAAAHQDPGEPGAVLVEEGRDRLLLPLVLRAPGGPAATPAASWRDATTPRGYGGPVVAAAPHRAADFLAAALDALPDCLREAGVVSLFCRLHPLLHPPGVVAALERGGPIVEHGASVSVDLALDDDAWRRTIRSNHRRDIDRAVRTGYIARIDAGWERFDDFVEAYRQSMDRLDASPFWRLSRTYFQDLHAALGERLHLAVVERDGDLAAAGLLTEVDGLVEYHLAGTMDRHVSGSPSKLLVDFARRWARERGNKTLHLAGSLERGDSLEHFKAGFSTLRHPVRSWRLVTDPARYGSLVTAWEAASGRAADGPDGFFPPYRRPIE